MITISIIEDQRDMRESLAECLGKTPGLRCVGAHATGEDGLRDIPRENPDVVLMDINLPGMNGIQCVARLKKRLPNLQVLMLTTYDDGDLIFDSLRAGANGYLLKNMPPGGDGAGRAAGPCRRGADVVADRPQGDQSLP
jgi:DNA-binding NarL/FixJ family response regulator